MARSLALFCNDRAMLHPFLFPPVSWWYLTWLHHLWNKAYLVEADEVSKTTGTDGIEETEGSDSINVSGVLGHVKGDLDVGLSTQVIDLGGEDLGNDVDEAGGVGQVTVVKTHLGVYRR